jgi:bifunctional non-homologous end joining protein LigD
MGKHANAPYRSGRSTDWIKLKRALRQEFVIGGFTRARGATSAVRSLLLGVHELDGSLRYAGSVTPHLSTARAAAFFNSALPLARPASPFKPPPRLERGPDYYWVRPELVCEVSFLEWTRGGEIRHASFHALRNEKPAGEIVQERPAEIDSDVAHNAALKTAPAHSRRDDAVVCGVRITNPGRVVDASAGHTKLEVARYYDAIAEWALPWLRNWPLSMVRAPDGIDGELFFQKHAERSKIPRVEELPVQLHPGHPPLLVANNANALVGLAQMGVIELHSWNAVAADLAHPDRMIFDLDPDPPLAWSMMIEAALLLKVVLDELKLASFPKTSGGKGLHVVVPLTGAQGWEEVKAFSKALAQHMHRVVPQRFSAVSGPRNRSGKIFIDYLRNSKGATSVAAFSVRARPGMGVSMPVAWEEVRLLTSADQWNMQSAVARQRRLGGDVWQNFWTVRQSITASMRRALGAWSRVRAQRISHAKTSLLRGT